MGWRVWDHYDREAHGRWRASPWRERYSWQSIAALALIATLVGVFFWAMIRPAHSAGLSDADIAAKIVQESREAYLATGHPCACPYDRARNGSSCGARSAYSRPGGASPKCFSADVPKAEIGAYRRRNRQL